MTPSIEERLKAGEASIVQESKVGSVSMIEWLGQLVSKENTTEPEVKESPSAQTWAQKIGGTTRNTYGKWQDVKEGVYDSTTMKTILATGTVLGSIAFLALPEGSRKLIGSVIEDVGKGMSRIYHNKEDAQKINSENVDKMMKKNPLFKSIVTDVNVGSDVLTIPVVAFVMAGSSGVAIGAATFGVFIVATTLLLAVEKPELVTVIGQNIKDLNVEKGAGHIAKKYIDAGFARKEVAKSGLVRAIMEMREKVASSKLMTSVMWAREKTSQVLSKTTMEVRSGVMRSSSSSVNGLMAVLDKQRLEAKAVPVRSNNDGFDR